ncbi:hypothetical protein ACLQ81_17085, partial [Bordetella avium]
DAGKVAQCQPEVKWVKIARDASIQRASTMTIMISEVYEAFRAAGVPEDKARKAAEAMSAETLATKTDVAILKWMVGFNLAFTMAMLWKIFS